MAGVQSGLGWLQVEFMQEIALSMNRVFGVGRVSEGTWSKGR